MRWTISSNGMHFCTVAMRIAVLWYATPIESMSRTNSQGIQLGCSATSSDQAQVTMTELDRHTKDLRGTILKCIQDHLNAKLDKLEPDEHEKRAKLEADHQPETWLAAAARQVSQIQLATHIVK